MISAGDSSARAHLGTHAHLEELRRRLRIAGVVAGVRSVSGRLSRGREGPRGSVEGLGMSLRIIVPGTEPAGEPVKKVGSPARASTCCLKASWRSEGV